MKYVDASAVLRVLFVEPGPSVPLLAGDHVVSSQLIEVETFGPSIASGCSAA